MQTDPASEAVEDAALQAVRRGNQDVFEALYIEHARAVHRFCVARSGHPEDAEDLMSVVFLVAWSKRTGAFLVDGSLLPWLLGIARNVSRTRWRSLRRHRAALARVAAFTSNEPDHAADVAESVDRQRRSQQITAAMASLTPRERDVVLLCLVEGLTPPAAAEVLHIPVGTVKSTLARGRARMRRVIRSGESSDPADRSGHYVSEWDLPASGSRIEAT